MDAAHIGDHIPEGQETLCVGIPSAVGSLCVGFPSATMHKPAGNVWNPPIRSKKNIHFRFEKVFC